MLDLGKFLLRAHASCSSAQCSITAVGLRLYLTPLCVAKCKHEFITYPVQIALHTRLVQAVTGTISLRQAILYTGLVWSQTNTQLVAIFLIPIH